MKKQSDKEIKIAELKGVLWSVFHAFDEGNIMELLTEDHESTIYDLTQMITEGVAPRYDGSKYISELKAAKALHQKILKQLKAVAKDVKKVKGMGY